MLGPDTMSIETERNYDISILLVLCNNLVHGELHYILTESSNSGIPASVCLSRSCEKQYKIVEHVNEYCGYLHPTDR